MYCSIYEIYILMITFISLFKIFWFHMLWIYAADVKKQTAYSGR